MIPLKKFRGLLGLCLLLTAVACNNEKPAQSEDSTAATPTTNEPSINVPAVMGFSIVNQYPHDSKAFTEGLEFRDGFLYESVGQYGRSDIRKTELATGKVLQAAKMEDRYFGEGLTLLNGKLYQLTYKEGRGFVYDAGSFKTVGTFSFPTQEGWGMTNNGMHLIFSDGSNKIYYMDPASQQIVKQLTVTDEHGPVYRINELEMIKGYLYANQWQVDVILKIDTATGNVVARADMSGLRMQGGIPPSTGDESAPETMNGIAYDAASNRIFVTGKNWPKLFEVKLDN